MTGGPGCSGRVSPTPTMATPRLPFADAAGGAQGSANRSSLIETCETDGVDLCSHSVSLFPALPTIHTADDQEALLPWRALPQLPESPSSRCSWLPAFELLVDADNVRSLVCGERFLGVDLLLQDGEIGVRGVPGFVSALDDPFAQDTHGNLKIENMKGHVA